MRFSIVITCHNQQEFIKDAVDSALSVREEETEIIVVDDASTDRSQDILRRYGHAIRLLCLETNRGACVARNCGASMATGEYLVFLDGDDASLPWALDVYKRIIQVKNPKMILGHMLWFRGALPELHPADRPHAIRFVDYEDYMGKDRPFGNSASALVIQRCAFQGVQGWPEELFPMEDQDLTIRLGDSGRTIQILSPATTLHRAHAGNTVNHVPPFLSAVYQLLERERSGQYPGGQNRRFERYGLIGGLIFFWAKRAVKCGLYWEAAKLFARGWPMVFAAVARRFDVLLTGRRRCETIAV